MRVFLAFGYNERDRWIGELGVRLVKAFGAEVLTGEDMQGEVITNEVRERIRTSDALIAFLTRRDDMGNGRWTTHRWVTDELSHALALNLPVAEVRETGVDDQGGIAGDRQRIVYDDARRPLCLVELAETVGRWSRGLNLRFQLLPEEFVNQVAPLVRQPGFRCSYRLLEGIRQSPDRPAQVVPIKGGLFVNAAGIPPQALIQIQVQGGGFSWSSDFESVDSLSIRLKQD